MRKSLLASLVLHATLLAAVVLVGRRAAAPRSAPIVAFEASVAAEPMRPEPRVAEPPFPKRPLVVEEEPEVDEPEPVEFEMLEGPPASPPAMDPPIPSVRLSRPLLVREPPALPASEPPEPAAEPVAKPAPQSAASVAPRPAACDAPRYPALARRMGQQGTVKLRLTIDRDGSVDRAEVAASSGFPMLDQAALRAARAWRFEPARREGRPVAAELVQPVEFHLR